MQMISGAMSTVERILSLMEEGGVKQTFIEGLLDSYRGKITEWKKGKSTPTAPELQIIADFFDVTIDYLLCKTNERKSPFHQFSQDNVKVVARIQGNLPKKDSDELYKIINENFDKFMLERKRRNQQESEL